MEGGCKAIEKIAADLVEMYAYRKVAKGFRYDPPGELYHEFEATFGFEETPDQAKAIQDVLDDMDRGEPMDRLICGDVGFGKTEVALRAAFRAAAEGRQVALLCPTTVLAEQHYQTFRARLAGFPVNVGLLSRFVTKPRQKEVLKAAAAGQIDILIGTHRILSSDVKLPNLALLVLDEEQRFGVRHKEKLKALKKKCGCVDPYGHAHSAHLAAFHVRHPRAVHHRNRAAGPQAGSHGGVAPRRRGSEQGH